MIPGATIGGRYQLEETVGQGRYGAVWRATDLQQGSRVAIKVLNSTSPDDLAEISHLAGHVHPHIIEYFGAFVEQGRVCLVMELAQGSIDAALSTGHGTAGLSLEQVHAIVLGIAQALAALHESGVVHQDVKPTNILVADDRAKLGDLGVAARAGVQRAEGRLVGSPAYMAPELFPGHDRSSTVVDPKSDVYALGVTVYQLLTGRLPFGEESKGLRALIREHIDRPPALPDWLPQRWKDMLTGCLNKHAQTRWSARDVVAWLESRTYAVQPRTTGAISADHEASAAVAPKIESPHATAAATPLNTDAQLVTTIGRADDIPDEVLAKAPGTLTVDRARAVSRRELMRQHLRRGLYTMFVLLAVVAIWRLGAHSVSRLIGARTPSGIPGELELPQMPVLSQPIGGITKIPLRPKLRWMTSDGASTYRVQVSPDASFGTIEGDITAVRDTSVTLDVALSPQAKYWWRVSAMNEAGASEWSQPGTFSTGGPPTAPVASQPASGAAGTSITPTLSWSAVLDTDDYHVQVASDSRFERLVFERRAITSAAVTVNPALGGNTRYWWRVRAVSTFGPGAWSEGVDFATVVTVPSVITVAPVPSVPVLLSPASGATGISLSPLLTWSVGSEATAYQIQLSRSPDFGQLLINQTGLTATAFTVEQPLVPDTLHWWRVRASNDTGLGGWSTAAGFTTVVPTAPPPPSAPVLSSPPNGATDVVSKPLLRWNPVSNAISYTVQVAAESTFGQIVFERSGLAEAQASVTIDLTHNTGYWWRVRATGSAGEGNWSGPRSFITQAPEPIAQSPHPYPAGYSHTWVISDPGVHQMRIHFPRIELAPYSSLKLFDDSGKYLTGYFGGDRSPGYKAEAIWTEWFTTDTIRVELLSGNVTGYGFVVDRKESRLTAAPETSYLAESYHPISPGIYTWTVSEPGANQMRIHFALIELAGGDRLLLTDASGKILDLWEVVLDGVLTVDRHRTLWFTTDTIVIRLEVVTGGVFGFAVDNVESR